MKRIIGSSLILVASLAVIVGGTGAFFSDTETSSGNVFTAGAVDLKIDHTEATYNGESCVNDCEEVGGDLIVNGGFEDPALNNGAWQVFPSNIPGWTVESGAGIEVQNNAAGAPHGGSQLVELDSYDQSAMSQTLVTVPGEKYRLTFWHSPRPGVVAGDNTIGYKVEVVSGPSTIISGQVGAGDAGGANTNWTKYTFDFVAVDASTKVTFSDEGNANNSYGGYLDDVSVRQLLCEEGTYVNTPGGFCQLWDTTDLTTEKFFKFYDVKPQDEGTNLISMHVDSNEAYLCLAVENKQDNENTNVDPEQEAGDVSVPQGELGKYLMVMGWYSDVNGNELSQMFPPTTLENLNNITFADSNSSHLPVAPNTTEYIKLTWCLGSLSNTGVCNGNVVNINQTQTDSFLADLKFYAVQTRNNDEFSCEDDLNPVLEP